jgi:membrane protease YdiL (CAAX protease family)
LDNGESFSSDGWRKILGLKRLKQFAVAFKNRPIPAERCAIVQIIGVIVLGIAPFLSALITKSGDFTSVIVGIGGLLSLLHLARAKELLAQPAFRRRFSLIHTGFALGCIPAVIVIILFPHGLYALHATGATKAGVPPHPAKIVLILLCFAVWSGFTEELLYRGLLLRSLRRWSIIKNTLARDVFALAVSSLIFGACHIPIWGIPLSIGVTGIGFGLGLGFLVSGEAIWPLAVYHSAFNFLSLLAAWLSYRT